MELVSGSNSFLALKGFQVLPSGKVETVWGQDEEQCLLKALSIAEKGSEFRYRVFSSDTELVLVSSGDAYHVAEWAASKPPIAILKGFNSEMQNITKLEELAGKKTSRYRRLAEGD